MAVGMLALLALAPLAPTVLATGVQGDEIQKLRQRDSQIQKEMKELKKAHSKARRRYKSYPMYAAIAIQHHRAALGRQQYILNSLIFGTNYFAPPAGYRGYSDNLKIGKVHRGFEINRNALNREQIEGSNATEESKSTASPSKRKNRQRRIHEVEIEAFARARQALNDERLLINYALVVNGHETSIEELDRIKARREANAKKR